MTDDQGNVYSGEEELNKARGYFMSDGEGIKNVAPEDMDSAVKQTYNMVFSATKSVTLPHDELVESVRESLHAKYPENTFLMAYHDDTDNPHVHVILKAEDGDGKRIDIRNGDLREIRRGCPRQDLI